MDYSTAMQAVEEGGRVYRLGWPNGLVVTKHPRTQDVRRNEAPYGGWVLWDPDPEDEEATDWCAEALAP